MAVPSSSQFLQRFPELSQMPKGLITATLESAGRVCSEVVWGDLHTDGVSWYAAHLLALRSRQVGASVNQPVAGPSGTTATGSTFYGQQYDELLSTLPLTGFVV
jgi:hypothetical protein